MVVKKEYWFIWIVLVGLTSACSDSSKNSKETNTKTSVNKPSNENTKIQAPNHQTVASSQSTTTAQTVNVPNQERRVIQFVPPRVAEYDDEYPPTVQEITDIDWSAKTQQGSDDYYRAVEPAPMPEIRVENTILEIVDEPAVFPGGMTAMREYLKKNLMYPAIAKDAGIQGKCYLRFIVNADGSISDVRVVRGVADCPECDTEAMRVVKSMPKWAPAKVDGKEVRTYYTLPISFKLT